MKNTSTFSFQLVFCALVLSSCGFSAAPVTANSTLGSPSTPDTEGTPDPESTPVPTPTPRPTLAAVITAHPWCENFVNAQQQSVQDRAALAANGQLTYQEFAYQNGQRGSAVTAAYPGTWILNGTNLVVNVLGQQISATVVYTNPDPVTAQERLHVTYSGQTVLFDPCN